jgi:hypothetical protein
MFALSRTVIDHAALPTGVMPSIRPKAKAALK